MLSKKLGGPLLIAATENNNGRKLLVIGLQDENIDRLKNDEPIYKNLSRNPEIPGLEEWDITILGPEDTVRFISHFQVR
jgi:hypothetical protein